VAESRIDPDLPAPASSTMAGDSPSGHVPGVEQSQHRQRPHHPGRPVGGEPVVRRAGWLLVLSALLVAATVWLVRRRAA